MSIHLINLARNTKLKLSGPRRHILLLLALYANDNKNLLCCPSIETLCEESGWSRRQVINDLKYLEELGVIKKEKKGKNNYYFIIEEVLKGEIIDKSYPQTLKTGAPRAPVKELSGARHTKIGAPHTISGARHTKIGAGRAPNNIYNNNNKNIAEYFLNEKKEEEEIHINHIPTIEAATEILETFSRPKDPPTENGRRHFEESMKTLRTSNVTRLRF